MRSGEEESYILLDDIRIFSMEKGFEIHSVIFVYRRIFNSLSISISSGLTLHV